MICFCCYFTIYEVDFGFGKLASKERQPGLGLLYRSYKVVCIYLKLFRGKRRVVMSLRCGG